MKIDANLRPSNDYFFHNMHNSTDFNKVQVSYQNMYSTEKSFGVVLPTFNRNQQAFLLFRRFIF